LKQVFRIDTTGYFIEPVILGDNETTPQNCVELMPTMGLYKAQYVNGQWREALPPEEIETIRNEPQPKTEMEILEEQNAELNLQIIDIWETILGGAE
jgi:hypothetical protein